MGIEFSDVNDATVSQLRDTGYPFILGKIDFRIFAFQFFMALTMVVKTCKKDLGIGPAMASRNHQFIAGRSTDFIDQGRGCRPMGIVQRGLVQQRKGALEHILSTHDASSRVSAPGE